MTIFLALNEVFRAPVHTLKVPGFREKVKCLTDDRPANQTVIRKEFEVREHYLNCHVLPLRNIKLTYNVLLLSTFFNLKGFGYFSVFFLFLLLILFSLF